MVRFSALVMLVFYVVSFANAAEVDGEIEAIRAGRDFARALRSGDAIAVVAKTDCSAVTDPELMASRVRATVAFARLEQHTGPIATQEHAADDRWIADWGDTALIEPFLERLSESPEMFHVADGSLYLDNLEETSRIEREMRTCGRRVKAVLPLIKTARGEWKVSAAALPGVGDLYTRKSLEIFAQACDAAAVDFKNAEVQKLYGRDGSATGSEKLEWLKAYIRRADKGSVELNPSNEALRQIDFHLRISEDVKEDQERKRKALAADAPATQPATQLTGPQPKDSKLGWRVKPDAPPLFIEWYQEKWFAEKRREVDWLQTMVNEATNAPSTETEVARAVHNEKLKAFQSVHTVVSSPSYVPRPVLSEGDLVGVLSATTGAQERSYFEGPSFGSGGEGGRLLRRVKIREISHLPSQTELGALIWVEGNLTEEMIAETSNADIWVMREGTHEYKTESGSKATVARYVIINPMDFLE